MLVVKWLGGAAVQARLDGVGDVASLLLGRRRDAGHRLAVGAIDRHGIADGEDVGMAGNGEVGVDLQTAGAVGLDAQPFGGGRGAHAGGPDDGLGLQPVAAIDDTIGAAFGDGLVQHHLDADAFQRALRVGREIVGEPRQHAGAGFDQHHARALGVDVAEVGRQRVLCQFGNGAGEFDAGRTGPDNDKRQPCRAPLRIGFALGTFEGDQDPPPQRGGVLQRLQAGRERLPFVMAEIGVAGPGGENQRVVGQGVAVLEQHALFRRIHAAHRGEQGRDFGTAAQQIADRPGNLRGRQ